MYSVSGYQVEYCIADRFGLDGGAMFGVVPKALWSRRISCDDRNRIPLVGRVLVLRSPERLVLVDLGMGTKWNSKDREIFNVTNCGELSRRFTEQSGGKVTDVILTHLHFDHVGGVSYRDGAGKLQLSFPQARHYLSAAHYEYASQPIARERASFIPDNVAPLAGCDLKLVELGSAGDSTEILPGITVERSDGHTRGLLWVRVGSGAGAVVFPTDLVPTAHHLPVPYVMAYDTCAERSMAEKESFLSRAVDQQWVVVFAHDADTPAATIGRDGEGRFVVERRVEIPEYILSAVCPNLNSGEAEI